MNLNQDLVTKAFSNVEFDDLLNDLTSEIKVRNYEITRISNLDNINNRSDLQKDFYIGFQKYKIVEFCNLNSCAAMVSEDLLYGVFLPLRFIVYQPLHQKTIQISYLKPSATAKLFSGKAMKSIAKLLEQDMENVLEEISF
ncbi:MAG: DUF302 domain-containing protein [SAR324 cluster bacterium]|nr:DUF302 domain-containing protein [SAR324 cluster bacterium]